MTPGERNSVLDALHGMEIRFTGQLATLEAEVKEWRRSEESLAAADTALTRSVHMLTTWLSVVTLVALGDGVLRIIPLI